MRTVKWLFLLVLVLMACQQIGHAEIYCKIKGRVIDSETRQGIPNVYVNAHLFEHDSPRDYYVKTDEKGYFIFSNLRIGRYKLNYDPLYPYVPIPDQEHIQLDWIDSFVIGEGEIKHVEQELQKGGELILKPNLAGGNLAEYDWWDTFLVRVEGDEFKKNIHTITHRYYNPAFKQAPDGVKISGLAPGKYIISRSLKKKSKYYSGEDVEYAGLVRVFDLEKLEKKILDLDYTSASKIIFNVKDRNGNKFCSGNVLIYKEIKVNNITGFYRVWDYSYRQKEVINPILIEPGKYFISFYGGGELVGQDGKTVEFASNDFLVNIKEGEIKQLNLVVSIGEREFPGIDDMTFIY